jgi:hypothetical protein
MLIFMCFASRRAKMNSVVASINIVLSFSNFKISIRPNCDISQKYKDSEPIKIILLVNSGRVPQTRARLHVCIYVVYLLTRQ